jgi:hypothetical protein
MAAEMEFLQAQARWNAKSNLANLLREMAAKVGLDFDRLLTDLGTWKAFELVVSKYSETVATAELREKFQQIRELRDQALE